MIAHCDGESSMYGTTCELVMSEGVRWHCQLVIAVGDHHVLSYLLEH